jgi:post-segregation antitoxin (ccd killing protein)
MSTQPTTIRVPIVTRDRLAVQARERGVSISALLTQLATRAEHEEIFRVERDTTRAEAAQQAVRDENRDWDTTVDDGLG